MVNMWAATSAFKISNDDHEAIAEMHVVVDDLCCQNYTLEDNILNLQQH